MTRVLTTAFILLAWLALQDVKRTPPVPLCTDKIDQSGACNSQIKGAPLAYVQGFPDKFSDPLMHAYYEKNCPSHACMLSFSHLNSQLRRVDFSKLMTDIVVLLHDKSHKQIAFYGTSGGELLVTTKLETTSRGLPRYYQVLLVANSCSGAGSQSREWTCSILGGAQIVEVSGDRHSLSTDKLCEALEEHILGQLSILVTQ